MTGLGAYKNSYPHGNHNILLDYVEELILLNGGIQNKVAIEESNGGFEMIPVTDLEAVGLNIPNSATNAQIEIHGDESATNPSKLVRYKFTEIDPTPADGFLLGDMDVIHLELDEMEKLKVIGVESGKVHKIVVQYYR